MKPICIIPARGGSKRIPRKNVRDFCGKPMIAWSIEAARQSGCFDRIAVSTDDDEIAAVAQNHGAEVPFRRPAKLADDQTGTVAVVAHAVEWFRARGELPELLCCLYATAPFVRAEDLARTCDAVQQSEAAYAFSVTSYTYPVQRALRIDDSGRLVMLQPGYAETRSQDLEETWHDAGQFYWGRSGAWLARKSLMTSRAIPFVLPRLRVQDIDTPEDWKRAEVLFRILMTEEAGSRPA